jgi:DNA-binding transcriptional LysR family regulator
MIDLKGADLSLLVSLDALIDEANVTKAAERLNISQPALSAQLARLRNLFHDPLLISAKGGRGMVLTPRALELKLPFHLALKDLESVVKRPPTFDPVSADRTFSIACSDQVTAVLGVRLIARAQKLAGSGVRISFRTTNPELIAVQLERGQLDLLIGDQRNVPHGITSQRLCEEHHVMAQRNGHPRGTIPLDSKRIASSRPYWCRIQGSAAFAATSTSNWKRSAAVATFYIRFTSSSSCRCCF